MASEQKSLASQDLLGIRDRPNVIVQHTVKTTKSECGKETFRGIRDWTNQCGLWYKNQYEAGYTRCQNVVNVAAHVHTRDEKWFLIAACDPCNKNYHQCQGANTKNLVPIPKDCVGPPKCYGECIFKTCGQPKFGEWAGWKKKPKN